MVVAMDDVLSGINPENKNLAKAIEGVNNLSAQRNNQKVWVTT